MTTKDYFLNKIRVLNIPITAINLDVFLQSKNVDPLVQTTDFHNVDIFRNSPYGFSDA